MGKSIEEAVRSKYGSVALSGLSGGQAGVQAVAEAFGYTPEELAAIPAEPNMGLSCGNPTATASLKPGEFVVDLGSGGGLDVFLAARKVGPASRAIGIDMTPEMIDLARRNAAKVTGLDGRPLANVEFHHATIDRMPLADASADCVISNCVLTAALAHLELDRPLAVHDHGPCPGRAVVGGADVLGVPVPGVDHVELALAVHDHVGDETVGRSRYDVNRGMP
jgi:SAM-dependent methyltransferase